MKIWKLVVGCVALVGQTAMANDEVVHAQAQGAEARAQEMMRQDPSIEMIVIRAKKTEPTAIPAPPIAPVAQEPARVVEPQPVANELDHKIDVMAQDLKSAVRDYLVQSVDEMQVKVTAPAPGKN